jgi:hypothetical protein
MCCLLPQTDLPPFLTQAHLCQLLTSLYKQHGEIDEQSLTTDRKIITEEYKEKPGECCGNRHTTTP